MLDFIADIVTAPIKMAALVFGMLLLFIVVLVWLGKKDNYRSVIGNSMRKFDPVKAL